MARPRKIDPEELRTLVEMGWSNKDLQEHFDTTLSAISQWKTKLGIAKGHTKHKFPWDLAEEHKNTTPHQYMKTLARKGDGYTVNATKLKAARGWAKGLVLQGLDIDYGASYEGTELSPFGGFKVKEATEDKWLLRDLLDKAGSD